METMQETELKEIKRFDAKIESKLLSALNKVFPTRNAYSEDKAVLLDSCAVMCPANVSMCIAKSEEAKRVLSRFLREEIPKIPELDYSKEKGNSVCRYSIEYLKAFMDVFNIFDKAKKSYFKSCLKLSVAYDYPMKLENEHFCFILAPRMDSD